jgi:signal transduction histidine kinase
MICFDQCIHLLIPLAVFSSLLGICTLSLAVINAKIKLLFILSGVLLVGRIPVILTIFKFNIVNNKVNFVKRSRLHLILQAFMVIMSSLIAGLFLIGRIVNGRCKGGIDQTHVYGCNSEMNSRALPQEHVALLLTIPVLYAVFCKSLPEELLWLSWLLSVLFVIAAIVIDNATQSISCLVINGIVSFLLIAQIVAGKRLAAKTEMMNQGGFQGASTRSADSNPEQVAQMLQLEESQNELRHMIANVAHDLKTVRYILISECHVNLSSHPIFLAAARGLHEWCGRHHISDQRAA